MSNKPAPELPADPLQRANLIAAAITKASNAAIEEHWRAGRPVVVWQDNRVVWLGPHGEVPPPSDI